MFNRVERHSDARAAYQKVIDTYSADPNLDIRSQVASAMFDKGVDLDEAGRHEDARAVYRKVIDAYSADTNPKTREVVAGAHGNLR